MKAETEQIKDKVISLLSHDSSLFLVDIILKGPHGNKKLLVLVDGDSGISIDICSEVSRNLSSWLDETNLIDDKYILEVSSPGLDYPLSTPRQYKKNIGRNLQVLTNSNNTLEGKLEAVSEHEINMSIQKKGKKKEYELLTIPYTDIKRTKVLVTF